MIFNQQVTEEVFKTINSTMPDFNLAISAWIKKEDMTDEEKRNTYGWSEMGGYLKTLRYEPAWEKWWNEAKQSDKDKVLNCGYFDPIVFKGITGIEIQNDSLSGQEVEVKLKGKTYKAIIQ